MTACSFVFDSHETVAKRYFSVHDSAYLSGWFRDDVAVPFNQISTGVTLYLLLVIKMP